jgi:hypothetical protein
MSSFLIKRAASETGVDGDTVITFAFITSFAVISISPFVVAIFILLAIHVPYWIIGDEAKFLNISSLSQVTPVSTMSGVRK